MAIARAEVVALPFVLHLRGPQAMGNAQRQLRGLKAGYRPERAKAMALLDESLAISRELGMRPLLEQVLSRREIPRT